MERKKRWKEWNEKEEKERKGGKEKPGSCPIRVGRINHPHILDDNS